MASLSQNAMNRLTDYSITDEDSIVDIRTELLDPIVSSNFRYQFRLDASSFLDKNTMLLFKMSQSSGNSQRLNVVNGAFGALSAIEFQVGDFQVQRIEDVNLWATLNSLLRETPAVQNKKLGHYLQNQAKYEVLQSNGAGDGQLTGAIQLDNTNSGINFGATADGSGAGVNSMSIQADADNSVKVGIPLGMILPLLRDREIPLFVFSQYKIHITFEFSNRPQDYVNDISKTNFAGGERMAATAGDVAFHEVQLLVDYLVLPARVNNSVLEQTRQEGGYMLDFINPLNVKKRVDARTANTKQRTEHRINVVNMECHYIQGFKQFEHASSFAQNYYDKIFLGQRCDGVSREALQYNVNGVDIFTAGSITNPVELYNNVSYTLDKDLQVVKPVFMNDPNTQASLLSPPELGLQGKFKPLCLDLRNGEPKVRGGGRFIGDYPIRVIYDATGHAAQTTDWFSGTNVVCAPDDLMAANATYFVGVSRVLNVKTQPNGNMSVVLSDM